MEGLVRCESSIYKRVPFDIPTPGNVEVDAEVRPGAELPITLGEFRISIYSDASRLPRTDRFHIINQLGHFRVAPTNISVITTVPWIYPSYIEVGAVVLEYHRSSIRLHIAGNRCNPRQRL